jgi:hypothetical protein
MALKDETKLRERREEKRKLLSTSAEFRSNECKMHFLIKTNEKKKFSNLFVNQNIWSQVYEDIK